MADDTDFYTPFSLNETDMEYAMNPGQFRRQTKEQQVYGVFLSDSDEEDNNKQSSSRGKKRADYRAPVSFISGGIKKGSKIEITKGEEEDQEEEATGERPSFGGSNERSVFGKSKKQPQAGAQVIAGMRSSAFHGTETTEWTKNCGKGSVIMKMMQNMGYVHGKGLGANKQGIVEPIQAFLRPGRGAIGAYGKEGSGPKFGESAADAQKRIAAEIDEDNDDEPEVLAGKWKKVKKPKTRYKTLEEMQAENVKNIGTMQQSLGVKIIDMTGPEQRVYDDFNAFQREQKGDGSDDSGANDVDLKKEDAKRSERELKFLKENTKALMEDQIRIQGEVKQMKSDISHLCGVVEIIRQFQQLRLSRNVTLDECRLLFLHLRRDYALEYKLYGLDLIVQSCVLPIFKQFFAGWDPLDPRQSTYGLDVLCDWRDILNASDERGGDKSANGGGSMYDHFSHRNSKSIPSPYYCCVFEGWMPPVRQAVLSWNPRDNGPAMVNLIEAWMPLLPVEIAENLMEQFIVPKISEHVEAWNPTADHIPIDSWILPWNEIMGDRLLPVYAVIRQKLSKALRYWNPGDRSAIQSIRPWRSVFSRKTMHSFVGMNIVPKLERALQAIDISTTEQFKILELFNWTELELITNDEMCRILVHNFFPRFYQILCAQLSAPNVVLKSVGEFYKGWKDAIPFALSEMQNIRNEWSRALVAISQVAKGVALTPMAMPPPLSSPMHVPPQFLPPPMFPPPAMRPPPPPPPDGSGDSSASGTTFFRR